MGEIPGRMNHSQAKTAKNGFFSKWHGNDYLETAGQPFSDEKLPFERQETTRKKKSPEKKKNIFRLRYFYVCRRRRRLFLPLL
jgi:hypothetical protein